MNVISKKTSQDQKSWEFGPSINPPILINRNHYGSNWLSLLTWTTTRVGKDGQVTSASGSATKIWLKSACFGKD